MAATLISRQLNTPNYRPLKRKRVLKVSNASNPALTTALDATVTRTEGQSPNTLRLCDPLSLPGYNNNSQDKQLYLSDTLLSLLESTSSPALLIHEGQPPLSGVLPAEFANLKEVLRAKALIIRNKETVEHL